MVSRARQGMVIFVPPGDAADPTRLPEYHDGTYELLRSVGVGAALRAGARSAREKG